MIWIIPLLGLHPLRGGRTSWSQAGFLTTPWLGLVHSMLLDVPNCGTAEIHQSISGAVQ